MRSDGSKPRKLQKSKRQAAPKHMDRLPLTRCVACIGPTSMESKEAAKTRSKLDDELLGDDDAATATKRIHGVDSSSRPSVPRSYKRSDLSAFNLLANRPVWVFDVESKAMWWANDAALTLWNAPSLDALLSRDFSDMSQATCKRLEEMMKRFRQGERVSDQWTYYPNGQGAVTVNLDLSGIYIDDEDGSPPRIALLNDGQQQDITKEIEKDNLRSIEILRHLPVAVGRFDVDGGLMAQNPEALNLFGSPRQASSIEESAAPANDSYSSSSTTPHFLERFVDRELGRRVLKEVVESGGDFHVEAQQHTIHGPRWFAIDLRRSRDPITAENNILYSAQDISSLVQAKKEADQANSAKDEFFAVLGHEIRTPLHQVNGFIELLSRTELTEQQTEYVNLVDRSSQSMMCVINDLLDYTKLAAGKMEIESTPFDPKDVASGTLAVIKPRAREKGLVLRTNLDSVQLPTTVIGDPNRLRQLLLNFLNNSVNFTRVGEIFLNVSEVVEDNAQDPTKAQSTILLDFSVSDTGIGLSPDHKEIIFEKYQQATASIARQYGGTGIGLALCKNLTEKMGGTIGVESEIGEGARFWLRIPFHIPSTDASNLQSIAKPVDAVVPQNLNVLVAEDNKVNQKLATAMLKRLGHSVTVVEDGQKAVEAVQKTKFDLILMDIMMPVMDGLIATRQIRKSFGFKELPIIGLTANYRKSERETYLDVGMNDCIPKPVRMESLTLSICSNVGETAPMMG